MTKRKQSAKGKFNFTNPQKYFGGSVDNVTYRSSWEWDLMRTFDKNPMVLGWSSETVKIPYYNPTKKGKPNTPNTVYVPDFLVVYIDRQNKKRVEMIEVKPAKEVMGLQEKHNIKTSKRDKAAQAINMMKWEAAIRFCKKRSMRFRVMTEYEIYSENARTKKRK